MHDNNGMKNNVLKMENTSMQFGGVLALNNLNLDVYEGEIVGLIGPNGAGKTTAFNVVTGVYPPTNGAVYLDREILVENYPQGKMKELYSGENKGKYTVAKVLTPDRITKLRVARTFQNIRLFKDLTVYENVLIAQHVKQKSNWLFASLMMNHKEEKAMREEAIRLLDILDLVDVKEKTASSLPYGQQRHIEIARALATDPKLLLLDEPAAGMNPQESDELMHFIGRIRKDFGLSILMIEHHMQVVMGICERIYVLDYGKLIAEGSPKEIQSNKKVIEAYLGVDD